MRAHPRTWAGALVDLARQALGGATLMLAAVAVANPIPVPPNGHIATYSQPPNMGAGTDWRSLYPAGPVIADDFGKADARRIDGLHWWGSYLGGGSPEPGLGGLPLFEVALYAGGGPVPGAVIFENVIIANEVFFGTTTGGEKVYEYWAALPPPWPVGVGQWWLSIAYDVDFGAPRDWGWHEGSGLAGSGAVQRPAGASDGWQPLPPATRDMAFEILHRTSPEPASAWLVATAVLLAAATGAVRRRRVAGGMP